MISDPEVIAYLNPGSHWRDLASVALVEAQLITDGQTTTEQRYYLLDQVRSSHEVHALARCHWGIENRVHWGRDIIFHQEDASRIRTCDTPQHMDVVRYIALNLLRQEPSKGSVKTKRFRTALSDTYLERVLEL